jgi:hypothetical protein
MREKTASTWKYAFLNASAALATALGFWSVTDKSRLFFNSFRPVDYLDFVLSVILVLLALGIAKTVSDLSRGSTGVKVFWSSLVFAISASAVSWISYQSLLGLPPYQYAFLRLNLPLAVFVFPVWAFSYHLRRHLDRIENFHRRGFYF